MCDEEEQAGRGMRDFWGGDEYVHCLDCGGGSMGIYIRHNKFLENYNESGMSKGLQRASLVA